MDDAKAWATRTGTYDAAGRLASLRITFDEGHVSQRMYTDGVLTRRIDNDVTDAFDWVSRSWAYDANGLLKLFGMEFDNAVILERLYTDGVLDRVIRIDANDVVDWSTRTTIANDAGAILFTNWRYDDGRVEALDSRGRAVFEGTTTGTLTEDADPNLTASGQITFTDGYRGSQQMSVVNAQLGSAGLGTFTVAADGSWTYSAPNNQAGIQTLDVGETVTESLIVTTRDGAEVELSVTIEGQDDSAAPIYVGGTSEVIGAVGNLAAPLSFDLGSLFSDELGEDLAISITTIPSGYSVIDGVVTLSAADPFNLWGTQTVEITATGSTGQFVTQSVDLIVGAEHSFGDRYPEPGFVMDLSFSTADDTVIFGTEAYVRGARGMFYGYAGDDTFQFGDNAALGGELRIDGGADDDTYQFGNQAAGGIGFLWISDGSGDDAYHFGSNAANGRSLLDPTARSSISIEDFAGRDSYVFGDGAAFGGAIGILDSAGYSTVSFGNNAGSSSGRISFSNAPSFDVADITFGDGTAKNQGRSDVFTGTADDAVRFGDFSFVDSDTLDLLTGDGKDSLTFGSFSFLWGTEPGLVGFAPAHLINTGADDDTVLFGNFVSLADFRDPGETTGIDLTLGSGSGNDTATFGTDAGAALAQILIDAGIGDDTLTFGERAKFVSIQGGTGADTISFADRAEDIIVDLGADTDADSLTMGWFTSLTLTNYDHTIDSLSVARVGDWVWHMVDDGVGTTTLQASGGPLITFNNTTGVAGTDLLAGANLNRDVEFIGTEADKDLGVIGVGNATLGFSTNILSLFADPDITAGLVDSFSVSAGPLPDFMAFDGTTLSLTNLTDVSNVGLYSVNFTGNDIFGADVTETFTFEVGLHNDYGKFAPNVFETERVNGSAFSNVLYVGTVDFNFDEIANEFFLDAGARDDVITVDAVNMASDYSGFEIDGGTGDDEITIASFSTMGTLTNQTVNGGTGADTITFDGAVQGLTIDLGADTDADTLTFGGSVTDVTIQNWVAGDDAIVFPGRPAAERWEATVSGANLVYPNGEGQSFTVLGAAASDPEDVVTGITFNSAPTYVGPAGAFFTGEAGSDATEAFSMDLKTLFDTANIIASSADDDLVFGDASAQVSNFLIGTGMGADEITTGAFFGQSSTLNIDLGPGNDIATFGSNLAHGGNVSITGGLGDDIITIGSEAASSNGILTINAGTGADQISLGADAGAVTIDLGLDGNADSLTIDKAGPSLLPPKTITINIWFGGFDGDTITVTNSTALWQASESAGNKTFVSCLGDTIVVTDAAGVADASVISGLTFNSAPTYVGTPDFIQTETGIHGYATSVDMRTLFANVDLQYLEINTQTLPSNVTRVGDVLSVAAPTPDLAGDYLIDIRALDTLGASVERSIVLTAALNHNLGADYTWTVYQGTQFDDSYTYGDNAHQRQGVTLSTDDGDDALIFGLNAFRETTATIDLGAGNDQMTFGDNAFGLARASIELGTGDDHIIFGDSMNSQTGPTATVTMSITDSGGDDTYEFGLQASIDGHMHITDTSGISTITFDRSAAFRGDIAIDTADEADVISFGDQAASGGALTVNTNAGKDSITFANFAAYLGAVDVNSGVGNDLINFGYGTGRSGTLTLDAGTGDDTVTFGGSAGLTSGTVSANLGTGADSIQVGDSSSGMAIDFGLDADVDTLVFLGTITSTSISNWVQGTDNVDVLDHTAWSISSDDRTDTVLTDGTSTLTFEGITGLTDADDFLI